MAKKFSRWSRVTDEQLQHLIHMLSFKKLNDFRTSITKFIADDLCERWAKYDRMIFTYLVTPGVRVILTPKTLIKFFRIDYPYKNHHTPVHFTIPKDTKWKVVKVHKNHRTMDLISETALQNSSGRARRFRAALTYGLGDVQHIKEIQVKGQCVLNLPEWRKECLL